MRLSLRVMLAASLFAYVGCKQETESKPASEDKPAPAAEPAPSEVAKSPATIEAPAPRPTETKKASAPVAVPAKKLQEKAPAAEKAATVVTAPATPAAAKAPVEPTIGGWDNEDELVWEMDPKLLAAASSVAKAPGETEAFGVGRADKAVSAVWTKLGTYQGPYLKNWSGAFDQEAGSPTEVVDAFNELAFSVTGPTGFWRKTLPNQWLGCRNHADSAPCQKLVKATGELQKWDKVQKKLSKMSSGKARHFLSKNQRQIMAYFDNYVPSEINASSMKATAFYKKHLQGVMPE